MHGISSKPIKKKQNKTKKWRFTLQCGILTNIYKQKSQIFVAAVCFLTNKIEYPWVFIFCLKVLFFSWLLVDLLLFSKIIDHLLYSIYYIASFKGDRFSFLSNQL